MNNRFFFIALALFLTLGVGMFVIVLPTKIENAKNTSMRDINVTETIQEYVNAKYRYRISYPSSWKVLLNAPEEDPHTVFITTKLSTVGGLTIVVKPIPNGMSLSDWVKDRDVKAREEREKVGISGDFFEGTRQGHIGAYDGIEEYGVFTSEYPGSDVFVEHGGSVYDFSFPQADAIKEMDGDFAARSDAIQQMLKSFRFTD